VWKGFAVGHVAFAAIKPVAMHGEGVVFQRTEPCGVLFVLKSVAHQPSSTSVVDMNTDV
jgi:hypothetical protein